MRWLLGDGRPAIFLHVLRIALNKVLRICKVGLNLSIDNSFAEDRP